MKNKTKEDFLKEARERFGDKFDYSKINYVDINTEICIICPKHGEFWMTPKKHLSIKYGCLECGKEIRLSLNRKSPSVFFNEMKILYGDKYDFSESTYINEDTPIKVYCNDCKTYFWKTPRYLLDKRRCPGCPKIIGSSKQKTTESFIKQAIDVHGDKYNYDNVIYKSWKLKVNIHCNTCGIDFEQTPNSHLMGHGCPNCGITNKTRSLGTDNFISKAIEVHGDKYDYSEVNYINNSTPVKIYCNSCKKYYIQTPGSHLYGRGCPDCGKRRQIEKMKYDKEKFIELAIKAHGCGNYLYDEIDYIDYHTPVKIYDPLLDEYFIQSPDKHVLGEGNPSRNMSSGETLIKIWLNSNKIEYQKEFNIKEMYGRSGHGARADFSLIYNNIHYIIEYNGIQHYKDISFFGRTTEEFLAQRSRDEEEKLYCKNNNIVLIEIPYTVNLYCDIENFLNKTILQGIDPNTLIDYKKLYK